MSESESTGTDPVVLRALAATVHYGWSWSGPEPCRYCEQMPCGLIGKVHPLCPTHPSRLGVPKQVHRADACPARPR